MTHSIHSINKKFFHFTLLALTLLSSIFLYFNIGFWHSTILGIFLLLIYFLINSFWLGEFLSKFISLEKGIKQFFGFFLVIYLLTFLGGFFVAFYRLTPAFVLGILLFSALLIFFLRFKFIKESDKESLKVKALFLKSSFRQISVKPWVLVIFFLCFFLCLNFLFKARTGNFLNSPWEVIPPFYFYLFLILTFLTGLFIFSKFKVRTIILIIILHSFLLHAYLPIVYQGNFGGDKWRHVATVRYLQEEKVYPPVLFGSEGVEYKKIGPLKIPAVFIVGNKTSYSGQWAFNAIISWMSQVDAFYIDLILGYLLWSIFIPIFLFKLGQFLSRKKPFPLLLAFLPSIFYPFQFYGAINVPVGFGFLFFLFTLFFWLNFLVKREKKNLVLAILFSLGMYLNYILYFVLLCEIGLIIFIFSAIFPKEKFSLKKIINFLKIKKKDIYYEHKLALGLFSFILILLIPFLDLLSGLTFSRSGLNFSQGLNLFVLFLKKIVGYPTKGLFSVLVDQGNFIYLQMERLLSSSAFLSLIFWPGIISLIIWLLILYGFKRAKKSLNKSVIYLFALFLLVSLLNHFIGWYLMDGSRLFSKRLDLAIAFFMLILLGWGIFSFISRSDKTIARRARIYVVCIFLAIASLTVYVSGPQMQTATADEVAAAKYVWQEIKNNSSLERKNYCVLANTWPLLPLEAESNREIIAGNFPLYNEYAQPERVYLFKAMSNNPSVRYLKEALAITQGSDCYFMTERKWWNIRRKEEVLAQLFNIFGQPQKQIGEVYIYHYSEGKGK